MGLFYELVSAFRFFILSLDSLAVRLVFDPKKNVSLI